MKTHPPPRSPRPLHGFTLIELLVVIGIITLLLSMLIPALSLARDSSRSVKCLSNLRQVGLAFQMYAAEQRQYLPFPTTTLFSSGDQRFLWFNAIDQYLGSNLKGQELRTGVAGQRAYKTFKQCIVWELFEGDATTPAQTNKEAARTYKMNVHLMRPSPAGHAKITDVERSSEFVMVGDGVSLDYTGDQANQTESVAFYFEVNDVVDVGPALRHRGAANIVFVDGHAATMNEIKTITKQMKGKNNKIQIRTWESEYINASGAPAKLNDPLKSAEAQGLRRNPNMPLVWSYPPKLYRDKP